MMRTTQYNNTFTELSYISRTGKTLSSSLKQQVGRRKRERERERGITNRGEDINKKVEGGG